MLLKDRANGRVRQGRGLCGLLPSSFGMSFTEYCRKNSGVRNFLDTDEGGWFSSSSIASALRFVGVEKSLILDLLLRDIGVREGDWLISITEPCLQGVAPTLLLMSWVLGRRDGVSAIMLSKMPSTIPLRCGVGPRATGLACVGDCHSGSRYEASSIIRFFLGVCGFVLAMVGALPVRTLCGGFLPLAVAQRFSYSLYLAALN